MSGMEWRVHYPPAPLVAPLTVHLLRHLRDHGPSTPAALAAIYGLTVAAAVEAVRAEPWAVHKLTEQRTGVYTFAEAFADVSYELTDYGRDLLRWSEIGVNDGPHFEGSAE